MFYAAFVTGHASDLKIDQLCVFRTQASKCTEAFPTL